MEQSEDLDTQIAGKSREAERRESSSPATETKVSDSPEASVKESDTKEAAIDETTSAGDDKQSL